MKGYGQDPLRLGPHVFASTVTSHTANAAAYNRQDSGRMAIRTLTCLTSHLQCSPDGGDHASPNLRSLEHLFRLPFQTAVSTPAAARVARSGGNTPSIGGSVA